MKKNELRELYQRMFPEYPDIVTVKELREMLGMQSQRTNPQRWHWKYSHTFPQSWFL